ncbi:MAG: thioesterase family protein [Planctomycetota bacterium]|nr:thioesterase family protein [Planctomycetota bacterium]
MIFTKRFRYRFGDIDDAGIAYYPSFFHYFHCAFEDWWSDGLQTPYDTVLHQEKFGLPAVHIETDFLQPVRYGDEPDIHLGILHIGDTSVKFGYWMTLPNSDKPLCRARITTVSVNMDTMTKQSVPTKWREAFQQYLIPEGQFPTTE